MEVKWEPENLIKVIELWPEFGVSARIVVTRHHVDATIHQRDTGALLQFVVHGPTMTMDARREIADELVGKIKKIAAEFGVLALARHAIETAQAKNRLPADYPMPILDQAPQRKGIR